MYHLGSIGDTVFHLTDNLEYYYYVCYHPGIWCRFDYNHDGSIYKIDKDGSIVINYQHKGAYDPFHKPKGIIYGFITSDCTYNLRFVKYREILTNPFINS